MRLNQTLPRLRSRLGRPAFWGSALLLWALFAGLILPRMAAEGESAGHMLGFPIRLALGLFLWICMSPMAWEWTGDDRRLAPFGRGVLQSALLALLAQGLAWLLGEPLPARAMFWSLPIPMLGYALLGGTVAHRAALQDETARMERLSREAHGAQLRAQLSPHALLNALNGLAELVREDVGRAIAGMQDLASIQRHLLEWEGRDRVTLGEERDLVRRFLAIEALRLEDKLTVSWDWDPSLDPVLVPPLILQTLAENAIKHGVAPASEGGEIRISARCTPEALFLEVANTGLPPASTSGGVGLDNLVQRLQLAWGPSARFRLGREGAWTLAQIQVQGVLP